MRKASRHAALAVVLCWVGCGASRRSPEIDGGLDTVDASADAVAIDSAAPACVSDVPCSSDTQCVALAGHQCNLGLSPPRCQLVGCGAEGDPCAPADNGSHFGTGAEQELCAARSCRHPRDGAWICRVAPLDASECAVICAASRVAAGCDLGPCDATCAQGLTECAGHGGLSDVSFGTICSAAAVRTCGDRTLFRF